MRNLRQLSLIILFMITGGIFFGAVGLAAAGVATGASQKSSKRGFLWSGVIAALFWLVVATHKIASGQSPQLLALTGSVVQLSGPRAWLLVVLSGMIAFFAGGFGGWLGGSLRQALHRAG
jgi:hypothetical protein